MVTVGRDGQLLVGTEHAGSEVAVQPADLPEVLVQLRAANPAIRTVIKADRAADYGPIEDVMAALQEARITRFSLITDLEGA